MKYRLLIDFRVIPYPPVTMKSFTIQLKLTNIGDSVFPGGEITMFRIRTGEAVQGVSPSKLQKIPPIEANEFVELEPRVFTAFNSGAGWVEVQLKASDEQEVELFQTTEHNFGNLWRNVFPVRSAEHIEIMELLQKIVQLLEKGKA